MAPIANRIGSVEPLVPKRKWEPTDKNGSYVSNGRWIRTGSSLVVLNAEPSTAESARFDRLKPTVETETEQENGAGTTTRPEVASILALVNEYLSEKDGLGALYTAPLLASTLTSELAKGNREENDLTQKLYAIRHPDLKGRALPPPGKRTAAEQRLAEEWLELQRRIVQPALLSGPAIGPIHTGAPVSPELRRGVPPGAVLSPLAITLRGLRKVPNTMAAVKQIVVHNTSRGPASRAKEARYRHPAIDYALNYYIDGDGGFPHYVVDFNGVIYAVCDERYTAYHAGWVHDGGKALFQKSSWKPPEWWTRVWSRYGARTPIDLLPAGATGPNSRSIGIELLILPDLRYTSAQYAALARLIGDIERRHRLNIPAAPSPVLLGHEDYAPVTSAGGRATATGGWDPGAHRDKPYFDWSRVWRHLRGGGAAPVSAGSAPRTASTSRESTTIAVGLPALGGPKVPSKDYRLAPKDHPKGLARYGGGRVDSVLVGLRQRGLLSITNEDIDTFQRVANTETSGLVQALNTWDSAVVSIGFMQWTLKHQQLHGWIGAAVNGFRRFGIEIDPTRHYIIGDQKVPAIKGAATSEELRWNGWAERFYLAGLDPEVIAAEVEYARTVVVPEKLRSAKTWLAGISGGFDLFQRSYQSSLPLRGLFLEAHNNKPVGAREGTKKGIARAIRSGVSDPAGVYRIMKDEIVGAFVALNDRSSGEHIVKKTVEGARFLG